MNQASSALTFRFLADQPELTATLTSWFVAEWSRPGAELDPQKIEAEFKQRLHRDRIPLVLLAYSGEQLVATTSLKIQEMETHTHYQHWLGGVFVIEEERGKGYGQAIVQHCTQLAAEMSTSALYLYTNSHEGFYAHLGWQTIERPHYNGKTVAIMRKELTQ